MANPTLLRNKYPVSNYGAKIRFTEDNCDTIVLVSDIEAAVASFGLTPEMKVVNGDLIECPDCDGTGIVSWEYCDLKGKFHYMDDDCPCCDGTGECEKELKVPTGRMVAPENTAVIIDGVKFSCACMLKVVEGMKLMGATSLRHTAANKGLGNMFRIQDGLSLYVMPVIGSEDVLRFADVKTTINIKPTEQ